jgi:hypothetical protein
LRRIHGCVDQPEHIVDVHPKVSSADYVVELRADLQTREPLSAIHPEIYPAINEF